MTKQVSWVHPSVRDLVIEYLMSHAEARADFIRKADIDGMLLALSTAGGATGSRTIPFLRSDDDWRAAQTRLSELLTAADQGDDFRVLSSLQTTVQSAPDDRERDALLLLSSALESLRTKWSAGAQVVVTRSLQTYCSLSELLRPLHPLPEFAATWDRVASRGQASAEEIIAQADEEWFWLSRVNEWLSLASLIRRNEPRFLRQRSFDDVAPLLAGLVERCGRWVESLNRPGGDSSDDSDPEALDDDSQGDLDALQEMEKTFNYFDALFPQLANAVEQVEARRSQATELRENINARYQEWLEPVDPDDFDWDEDRAEDDEEEEFSVAAVFADL